MHENTMDLSPGEKQAMDQLHALILLCDIEDALQNLSMDVRELRTRIAQLGLLI